MFVLELFIEFTLDIHCYRIISGSRFLLVICSKTADQSHSCIQQYPRDERTNHRDVSEEILSMSTMI